MTERVTRMLEQIGHKLKRLHLCSVSLNDYSQIKGDMMEIHREMIMLWLNIIMTFRQQEFGKHNLQVDNRGLMWSRDELRPQLGKNSSIV